ncbi:WecB/TagA/CpsF family glycosyltransferase [Mycolicibacterium pallens]|uniref:WecB/TagA/CpsF family glycosyltransferase n=1 Tax=Mycolicibacterium pallens TaxID=370524 RepID=A0ABX8VQ07_9MYCO|nr:WecB/TagA/CpsF family glycosyltransferase [Mycolicibacterium pallens]
MPLGIGVSIDFFAGEAARVPKWMQRISIEWFHCIVTDLPRVPQALRR